MKSKTAAVAFCLVAAATITRAEIFEQVLVKVNGDIFTKSDLEQRQVAMLRQKGQQFDPKTDPKNEQLRKALDEITPQLMVDVIDEMLLSQRGKELGYRLSDEQFEKLAAEVSDSASKANSGLIGPISLNDISPDLKKLLDTMKTGDVSPVIRTPRGYQLLKLETMTTARTLPFDQAREQISDRVFAEKRKIEYQKYLDKLRTQA